MSNCLKTVSNMGYVFIIFAIMSITSADEGLVLRKGTFSAVGGSASSTGYILYVAGGQPSTGESHSTGYIEQAGFYTYGTVVITGVEEHHNVPITYFIDMPEPNPVHNSFRLRYGVPVTTRVQITMYDVSGRLVSTIVDEVKLPGYYDMQLGIHRLPTGVYFILMHADEFVAVHKLLILR